MSDVIRPAYSKWPDYNEALRDVVGAMSDEHLAVQPSADRWPLWATVGHAACQRVFWLCDVAREPGADTTPFTNAGYDCPGDDDLEHVWSGEALADALGSTFRIVERCLDSWTVDMLDEIISHPEWEGFHSYPRGSILQRLFAHDVYHAAEINESLSATGLPMIDFWD
jgi:DinB family protein